MRKCRLEVLTNVFCRHQSFSDMRCAYDLPAARLQLFLVFLRFHQRALRILLLDIP